MKFSMFPPPLPELAGKVRSSEPWLERLLPFVATFRAYRRRDLRHDFVAGLTTALFTVPQGMAYALIAGFPPSAGIATSVAASILGAAFGSSEFLINGPTNAISVMIAGNAALFAAAGDPVAAIVLLTLVVGTTQVLAGLLRIGALTRFVSESVLSGFTAGAGVYIVVNQLPSFFGLEKKAVVPDLWGWVPPHSALFDLVRLLRSLHGVSWVTFGLALLTFVTVRALQALEPRLGRKLPATFFAVVLATCVAWLFGLEGPDAVHRVKVVADIEPLRRALPQVSMPHIALDSVRALMQ